MPNKKLILEIGKTFGKWKIVSDETIRKNNLTHWLCQCACGREEYIPLNNLMNGSSVQCFDCAKKFGGIKRRKGIGEISGDLWAHFKSNASRKKIPFNLRIEEAWAKFEEQEGRCGLTNRVLKLTSYPYDRERNTASLSMIDPKLGYVSTNIIWLHRDIDRIKGNLTIYQLCDIANEIVNTL